MDIGTTISAVIHVMFAGAWTGSVIFMTYGVIPVARAGNIDTDPFADITSRLLTLSRASAVLMLLTGAHLAFTALGGVEALTGTTPGYLVIAMIVLWAVLAALVEIGTSRISEGLRERKVRTPAEKGRPFFIAGSAVALLLLVDAGVLLGL
ncbi:MAG: CopD family protein [Haloarculaceae archaeon]